MKCFFNKFSCLVEIIRWVEVVERQERLGYTSWRWTPAETELSFQREQFDMPFHTVVIGPCYWWMFEYHKETLRQSEESFELIVYLNCKPQEKETLLRKENVMELNFLKKSNHAIKPFVLSICKPKPDMYRIPNVNLCMYWVSNIN